MKTTLKKIIKRLLGRRQVLKSPEFEESADGRHASAVELRDESRRLLAVVLGEKFSMCPENNLLATAMVCQYVVDRGIEGDFIECGVWRGGHSIIAAGIFASMDPRRHTYLLDTFTGMSEPAEVDTRTYDGISASKIFENMKVEDHSGWCEATLDEVKANFAKARVPTDNVHFIRGDVKDTLANPELMARLAKRKISILRLDTDWFESTKIELEALWPLLTPGGIMIVDDYGYWSGAKKAVDEYFAPHLPFMSPLDKFARLLVKPAE